MISHATQKSKKEAMASVLTPIDNAVKAKFGESFATVVSNCPKLGLQKKPTAQEKRSEKRKLCRQIRDDMNEQLANATPLSVLA